MHKLTARLDPTISLVAANAAFVCVLAGCSVLDSRLQTQQLRICPSLAKTYLAQSQAELDKEFISHDLDTQYAIYICGNQYIHPPKIHLKTPFASQGKSAAMFLKEKLLASEISDSTVRDILLVFVEMTRQGTYDVRSDDGLMDVLVAKAGAVQHPQVRAYANELVKRIQQPGFSSEESAIHDVSIIQLLARGVDYDGKMVRVVGFCWLEFEGDALYLHEEDFRQGINKNSLVLVLPESPIARKWRELNGSYVIVEATFDPKDTGHFGGRSGALLNIRRMDRHYSRSEIERSLRSGKPQP